MVVLGAARSAVRNALTVLMSVIVIVLRVRVIDIIIFIIDVAYNAVTTTVFGRADYITVIITFIDTFI